MHITYIEIDSEDTPLGLLTLRQYMAETGETGYEILINSNFLMATHGAHSETAMAPLAHNLLRGSRENLRVLVGGLGAGHTLRAALDLPGVVEVVVAEIGAKVVEWNRRYFASANGEAVSDPRTRVNIADLTDVLRAEREAYDLLLLDVDNGPGWLAAPGNAELYEIRGVTICREALRPGGVLAVWSPQPNPTFFAALSAVFPQAKEIDTTNLGRVLHEPGDTVYLAVKTAE